MLNYSRLKSTSLNKMKSNYANRGLGLECDINLANEYYRINDIAYVYKKPTPIKLVDVDYKSGKIKEAYFQTPSTTDYNGIYKGKYIDFDAKEVKGKDSFVLSNLHKHQLEHLIKVLEHGGISVIIVRFYINNKTYLLPTDKIIYFIKNYERKSIPLSYFLENGYEIKDKYTPRVDYLEVLDKLYF